MRNFFLLDALVLCLIASQFCVAQVKPIPVKLPPAIAEATASEYPGVIKLEVDASENLLHIFRVKESIPVKASGKMTLLFPKWLPGEHAPDGPISSFAGLVIKANGKRIAWERDTLEMTAFHLDVPVGATELNIEITLQAGSQTSFSGTTATSDILIVKWHTLALYPAGYRVSGIKIQPSVKLPLGWGRASALDGASESAGVTTFKETTFETLVDSPLFAGKYFKSFDLDPGSSVPVRLNVFADVLSNLEAKSEQIDAHKKLVQQATKVFGSHHYDHYDFLLTLSEPIGFVGIEHHRSSENGYLPKYFTDWDAMAPHRDLLAHEFTHSWNGKFRRPADLWTPDFNRPMQNSLLWVYEGQTQFWGKVLAARSGLMTQQQTLDSIAVLAARLDNMPGRAWRNLQDTTNDEILGARSNRGESSWLRGLDYYDEGLLIWLDVDTLIREKTAGKKSLDDFARLFFGVENGSYVPLTYTFQDVVKTLNDVLVYDWTNFLRKRLNSNDLRAPLDGLTRAGYKLAYTDTPSDYIKGNDSIRKQTTLTYSIGLTLGESNKVKEVQWEGPAFKAGLTIDAVIVAVNGIPCSPEVLRQAIVEATKTSEPISLIIKADDRYRTINVNYHDGLRYPKLERLGTGPNMLEKLLTPLQ